MRYKLISCEVLFRESCDACARTPHQVDVEFLPKGLHDLGGARMAPRMQEAVDRTAEGAFDAILLGYGLCGHGLHGVRARHTRLVLPRAHDCIALLMGSRARYQQYFESNPGTYYRSTGWLERGQGLQQLSSRDALIAQYGEDNGNYLYEELTRYRTNYSKLAFIETGLESDGHFRVAAETEAGERGWTFEPLQGDLGWLRRLVSGEWSEDEFVIAEPGQSLCASFDSHILKVTP